MNLNYCLPTSIIKTFSSDIVQTIVACINRKKFVYLFLSGGSIISTYPIIADQLVKSKIDLSNLIIGQIDDRYNINSLHPDSNKLAILNSGIKKKLQPHGVNFFFMLNNSKIELEKFNYNNFVNRAIESKNVITISLLGIGEDAHVAGIKPMDNIELFINTFESDEFVNFYSAKDFPQRITLTISALRQFDYNKVFIAGNNKKKALEIIIKNHEPNIYYQHPGKLLNELHNCDVFTDIQE